MASIFRRESTLSCPSVLKLMSSPGRAAPKVIDTRLAMTPRKTAVGIEETLNQLVASLLGEFRTKMFPTAAKAEPSKHHSGWPVLNSILSHAPPMTRIPPMMKLILMPYFSSIQLAGKAMTGWAMEKSRALRVTYVLSSSNSVSTNELMLEKVWTGRELPRAARM